MADLFGGSACDPQSNAYLGTRFPVGSRGWEQIRAIATNDPVGDVLGLQEFLSQQYDDDQPVTLDLDEETDHHEGKMPELIAKVDQRLKRGGQVYQALVDRQFAELPAPEGVRFEDPIDIDVLAWVAASSPHWARGHALRYYFLNPDDDDCVTIQW